MLDDSSNIWYRTFFEPDHWSHGWSNVLYIEFVETYILALSLALGIFYVATFGPQHR